MAERDRRSDALGRVRRTELCRGLAPDSGRVAAARSFSRVARAMVRFPARCFRPTGRSGLRCRFPAARVEKRESPWPLLSPTPSPPADVADARESVAKGELREGGLTAEAMEGSCPNRWTTGVRVAPGESQTRVTCYQPRRVAPAASFLSRFFLVPRKTVALAWKRSGLVARANRVALQRRRRSSPRERSRFLEDAILKSRSLARADGFDGDQVPTRAPFELCMRNPTVLNETKSSLHAKEPRTHPLTPPSSPPPAFPFSPTPDARRNLPGPAPRQAPQSRPPVQSHHPIQQPPPFLVPPIVFQPQFHYLFSSQRSRFPRSSLSVLLSRGSRAPLLARQSRKKTARLQAKDLADPRTCGGTGRGGIT